MTILGKRPREEFDLSLRPSELGDGPQLKRPRVSSYVAPQQAAPSRIASVLATEAMDVDPSAEDPNRLKYEILQKRKKFEKTLDAIIGHKEGPFSVPAVMQGTLNEKLYKSLFENMKDPDIKFDELFYPKVLEHHKVFSAILERSLVDPSIMTKERKSVAINAIEEKSEELTKDYGDPFPAGYCKLAECYANFVKKHAKDITYDQHHLTPEDIEIINKHLYEEDEIGRLL